MHLAVLVVHGIGRQERGVTVRKLAEGVARFADVPVPAATGDHFTTTIAGRELRLYEVHWADVLSGPVTKGTCSMQELQSLAWFPWFNARRATYAAGSYSRLRLAWWWVVLPLANFLVLFAYHGADLLAQLAAGVFRKDTPPRTNAGGKPVTVVDDVLDEYAGDVVNYVNSAGQAFYREPDEVPPPPEVIVAQAEILKRFDDTLLRAAAADGCESIQVVAHSLGTVIAYHALSGFRARSNVEAGLQARLNAARRQVTHLYTLGCPLEKFRFFWPAITRPSATTHMPPLRWANFVSYLDPIAGRLRHFDTLGAVSNHRLLGGGFISGHVVYERSPVFLSALGEGLCGTPVAIARNPGERLRDTLILVGETLLAPVGLAAVLTIGAMLFVAVAALIPWGLSLIARQFVAEETWAPIVDTASLVLLGMMVLAFLVAPAVRASRAHRQYWGAPSHHEEREEHEEGL
jgi:hypothetical protein